MTTQTVSRHDIHAIIDDLSDGAIEKLAPYVVFLSNEEHENIPHIPNAETIAAMEEARNDLGEEITLDELKAQLDAIS